MKKTWIITALLALAIGAPSAFAKKPKGEKTASSGVFGRYDKNSNGVLDPDEKAAIQKAFGSDTELKKYDTNGDGKLDENEISAIRPDTPARKKKK
jgi:hypothetical protein